MIKRRCTKAQGNLCMNTETEGHMEKKEISQSDKVGGRKESRENLDHMLL